MSVFKIREMNSIAQEFEEEGRLLQGKGNDLLQVVSKVVLEEEESKPFHSMAQEMEAISGVLQSYAELIQEAAKQCVLMDHSIASLYVREERRYPAVRFSRSEFEELKAFRHLYSWSISENSGHTSEECAVCLEMK